MGSSDSDFMLFNKTVIAQYFVCIRTRKIKIYKFHLLYQPPSPTTKKKYINFLSLEKKRHKHKKEKKQ